MNSPVGMTREDSQTIGFVASCFWCSAINVSELQEWCNRVIQQFDVSELPEYIFDLSEFDGPPVKLSKTVGFEPSWSGTKQQEHALFGIALRRGRERYEWPVKPAAALRALGAHPEIEARFREVFPFLEIPNA